MIIRLSTLVSSVALGLEYAVTNNKVVFPTTRRKFYFFGVMTFFLVVSVVLNFEQYASVHRVPYVSNIAINTIPAPDYIVWNAQKYRTEGILNQSLARLQWLGTAESGGEDINVFEVVGVNPKNEIAYILGNRLVTATSKV